LGKKNKTLFFSFGGDVEESIDLQELLVGCKQVDILILHIQKYAFVKIYDKINMSKGKMEIKCMVSDSAQLNFFISAKNEKIRSYEFILQKSARVNIRGFYFLLGNQKCCLNILQKHMAENSRSNLRINGVAKGNASLDFRGIVFVSKEGKKSVVCQENKTLVFDNAKVNSTPSLEILNNDVSCKHATAVGRIDEVQLFYLQSRGLAKSRAKKMIIDTFLTEMRQYFYE
jgi:Fe-S cluster assembly protein SufD